MSQTDAGEKRDTQRDAGATALRIAGVVKRFGNFTAVERVSLDVASGEFVALLGPSGCGKTTLLRMLAGFETPDEGSILLRGEDIVHVPPHRRPVNMMFQSYALFPHLDVENNIAFGLKRAGMPRQEIASRVAELVALVRLEGLERRRPDQLSGGQRQRVALARSLARRPQILLLDEPMAALDKKLRQTTQAELKELQKRLGMTFIIVTHDQEEAMTLADRIGVMDRGRLVQVATPRQLYEAPNSRWIAGFVGDVNLLEGNVEASSADGMTIMTRDAGRIVAAGGSKASGAVCVAIRPEKIKLVRLASGSSLVNLMQGEVIEIGYRGGVSVYSVKLDSGARLKVTMTNASRGDEAEIGRGERVELSFSPNHSVVLEQ